MQKRYSMIGGAIAALLLAAFFVIRGFLGKSTEFQSQNVARIALCDDSDEDLCVISFGKNGADGMVIAFQLPRADYPAFQAIATNKGVENIYPCEAVASAPMIVYCTGAATPLGESLAIEIRAIEGNILIARGDFTLMALMVASSSSSFNAVIAADEKIIAPTPTPGAGYPNP
ncbi:MAG: hypothetical protein HYZ23_06140 [Chloroflexi bacterium]|nr:hypothetical protein [Chloroflexota bacterium]